MFAPQALESVAVPLALALLASSASAGGVRIVSPTGGQEFATIGPAVAAAADGDVLLVGTGIYPGFTIQGKGLTLVAAGPSSGGAPQVQVTGQITLRDLPSGGSIVIRGLTIDGSLDVLDCQGFVRVQDCTAVGHAGDGGIFSCKGNSGGSGAWVSNSPRVSFADCTLIGGAGEDVFGQGCSPSAIAGTPGAGLATSGGSVALYDCAIEGGAGGDCFGTGSATSGAPGMLLGGLGKATEVFVSGCSARGGDAGIQSSGGSKSGGPAAYLRDGSQLVHLDSTFSVGAGVPPGPIIGDGPFEVVHLPGERRSLDAPAIGQEGVAYLADLQGVAGDALRLLRAQVPAHHFVPALNGVLQVRTPLHVPTTPLGVVPAGGAPLQVLVPGVHLGPAEPVRVLATQGLADAAIGPTFLSGPRLLVVLSRDVGPDCNGNGLSDYVDVLFGGAPDANHNLIPDTCPGG